MNFKCLISFVILAVIALVQAKNENIDKAFEEFQNNPNRPLTVSEMIAILNHNRDKADPHFDAKRIFQTPTMCPQGQRMDSQGRCRSYMN